jgi:hypothetical protein
VKASLVSIPEIANPATMQIDTCSIMAFMCANCAKVWNGLDEIRRPRWVEAMGENAGARGHPARISIYLTARNATALIFSGER